MESKTYMERIGYRGPLRPSVEVLRKLHRRHMLSVPFENLDIHLGPPIILSENAFYNKIIERRRGGFCYELNGSFASLLKKLGFKVSMLSACVARKGGGFSPDFEHMTLLVQLKGPWLVDVGFGDSFTEPKRLDIFHPQVDHGKDYRFARKDGWILSSRRTKGSRFLGASVQLQPYLANPGGFHSEMSLATNLPKVSLQTGPLMHSLNSQWKIDPY